MNNNLLPELVPTFATNFRLLQWNIRGQDANGNMLDIMAKEFDPRLLCTQEANVQYHLRTPNVIPGFKAYADPYCKTSIYVETASQHGHFTYSLYVYDDMAQPIAISMDELDQYSPVDVLYVSSIYVRGQVAHYYIRNCYRSPNGNAPSLPAIAEPTTQDQQALLQLRWPRKQIRTIIIGDFNLSNELWGAPEGLARNVEGIPLMNHIQDMGFVCHSDGFCTRRAKYRDTIRKSWIDISCSHGFSNHQVKSITVRHNCGSDHLPRILDWDGIAYLHEKAGNRARWIIPSEFKNWEAVNCMFMNQWRVVQTDLTELMYRGDLTKKEKANKLYNGFKEMYDLVMLRFSQKESRSHSWKPWITGDIRKAIIEYHKFERLMNNREVPRGKAFWDNLKALRKKRDVLLKRRKREWITNKFSEHGLQGKDGWAIAAEVRNIGRTANNIIPDLHQHEMVLCSTKDKADAFNDHYHRFDSEPEVPLWPYHDEDLLEELGYDSDEDYDSALERIVTPDIDSGRRGNDFAQQQQSVLHKIKEISHLFHGIRKHRCIARHSAQLRKLNLSITAAEVRRAVSGFSSGKAAGPDDIYIGIIKKCSKAFVPILVWLFNRFLLYLQWIPDWGPYDGQNVETLFCPNSM